ncbi:MAG: tRNA pseudouridine(38-40) synthase TruA [Candidatus Omnitrophota bacterium]
MFNIKLTIEYDGAKYCGWQRQDSHRKRLIHKRQKPSIQGIIENSLKKILKQKVSLIASGRTDSGVHALGQIANFKTTSKIHPSKLKLALNGNIPKDIRIINAEGASLRFHSRFSARSKVYRYLILNQEYKSPFLKNHSYWFKHRLDLKLMQKAAHSLLGKHDFRAFCASGSIVSDTIRKIKRISIKRLNFLSCDLICIDIEADGFLYNMVRNIVGTLIDMGRGRFPLKHINEIIKSKNRSLAGPCVPAKGLFLVEVKYL